LLYQDELDQHVDAKDSIAAEKGTKERIPGIGKFSTDEEALIAIAERDQQEVEEAQQKVDKQQAKQEEEQPQEAEFNGAKRLK